MSFYIVTQCEYQFALLAGNSKWIYDAYIDFYIKSVIK
ncbi:ORF174 [Staphylococcus phage 92]|uniref:ORF174 n=1 Tax=Staphylococcus phage 92 TaxID=2908151 RepID=Q4ZAD3_9CAUD|nr:ORF174 [Staphylococcus phage 92]